MKKFLVTILAMLIPIIAIAQEPAPIPTMSTCNMLNGNQQESDYCAAWAAILTSSDIIRISTDEESHIFYVLMVNYDEASSLTSVSFTQLWRVPALGNITMIVWQVLLVDSYDFVLSAQSIKFRESMKVFTEWVQYASMIFRNICPPCDNVGKKRPVTASVTSD